MSGLFRSIRAHARAWGVLMARRTAVQADVPPGTAARERGPSRAAPPGFDASTFDQAYFNERSNYGGRYDWYNPPYKISGYLREVQRMRSAGDLLDVGCAFGRFLERARHHYRVEGMDISAYALGLAREVLPDLPLHHAPIETFAPGRTFDVVTCFDVLEHVPDLDMALQLLRALLRPDGIVALAVPVYDTLPGRVFGLIDRDPTHVHRHGRQFWLERLRANGLEPVEFKGILRIPLPRLFIHVISPLFWRFSSAIFVVCAPRPPGGR